MHDLFTVYIVDDDALIIDSLINNISWLENGFEVVGSCSNPDSAIKEILSIKPDVVFSDLKMPSIDGIELIKKLKENGLQAEYVMISAFGIFKDSRDFFLLEGFDYILKPLQRSDWEMVLERLNRKLSDKKGIININNYVPSKNKNFDELVLYLLGNYNKKLSLDILSNKFGLSSNYICNLFSKCYNSTFTVFLTNLRMTEAAKLVSTTDKALKEIAILCGYTDYFYFCKIFKDFYGQAPSKYRQNSEVIPQNVQSESEE